MMFVKEIYETDSLPSKIYWLLYSLTKDVNKTILQLPENNAGFMTWSEYKGNLIIQNMLKRRSQQNLFPKYKQTSKAVSLQTSLRMMQRLGCREGEIEEKTACRWEWIEEVERKQWNLASVLHQLTVRTTSIMKWSSKQRVEVKDFLFANYFGMSWIGYLRNSQV